MTTDDRLRWDQRYQENLDSPYPPPHPILFEFIPPVMGDEQHRALDLAGGLGQNGLWLAEQGYTVDVMDISRIALTRAQSEINRRHLRHVNLLQVDLDTVELTPNTYDVLCVCYYLHRGLFSRLRAAMKSGGRVVYVTFNVRYKRIAPQINPAYLLEVGELAGYFADWRILHNIEDTHISHLVAIKP
ncbi:MAG: class I SAM-dependent methyltransferase [Anaerolineae bacterium]|nr:class I SAM-dependent methyltransferase [Anaerolineae bacterium]